ncbi:protoporphyrinogen oxidase [Gordonia sp. CPCC 206044]|uniref:protoporphyrinogen oxidase n=1 Tax=Gordonia sp. CPCC 206044 TaxID=3140793 RepID=UPI003AF4097E
MSASRRVAVVGGGISGLTAALRLRQALGPDATIDVFEAAGRTGGHLRTVDVGGRAVDVGAEAFIVRRPEARDLVAELGLSDRITSPTSRRPAVWSRDTLHDLPTPALMGIPADARAVAGLADPDDVARIAAEPEREWHWDAEGDPSVGELVAERFGASVVARCVDPMLGGVYASLAGDIGLREAVPALAARLDAGASGLTAAVSEVLAAPSGSGPVFGALTGGYAVLLAALADAAGVRPEFCSYVRGLESRTDGWTVDLGDRSPDYDGVVLAIPAWSAGQILRRTHPDFAAPLRQVEHASSVVVSIALAPGTALPDHSGVLVATGDSLRAKAFTFSSQKWPHLGGDDGPLSVRASFGRFGAAIPDDCVEPGVDDRIRTEALEDLDRVCQAAGVPAPSGEVTDVFVQRWTRGLPVYQPGHLARMARLQRSRPARLVLAGSAYAGVGVPACIGQAGHAVAQLVADLT